MEKMTKTKAARQVVAGVFGSVEPGPNISDYEDSARAFLARTGARFVARYLGDFEKCREWGEDDAGRAGRIDGRGDCVPVFAVRITTPAGSMSLRFRGSVNDWRHGVQRVGVYDVLSCLIKSAPGSFDDFCEEFGYFPINSQADYTRARKTWRGCLREFGGVCRCWPDEKDREALAAIQ